MGPPQPVEIDVSSSRTLPSPSASSVPWDSLFTSGFGGHPDYGQSRPIPLDNQVRTNAPDPLQQWYTGDDGPWIPKAIHPMPEETTHSRGDRTTHYGNQYRQPSPPDAGSFKYGIAPSDSGYGTRRRYESNSAFSADTIDRDQDCQSLVGHVADFQPFQGLHEVVQQGDTRFNESWGFVPTSLPFDLNLVCPTCHKSVKTQSELKYSIP